MQGMWSSTPWYTWIMSGLGFTPWGFGASVRCPWTKCGMSSRSSISFSTVAQNCCGILPSLLSSISTRQRPSKFKNYSFKLYTFDCRRSSWPWLMSSYYESPQRIRQGIWAWAQSKIDLEAKLMIECDLGCPTAVGDTIDQFISGT